MSIMCVVRVCVCLCEKEFSWFVRDTNAGYAAMPMDVYHTADPTRQRSFSDAYIQRIRCLIYILVYTDVILSDLYLYITSKVSLWVY